MRLTVGWRNSPADEGLTLRWLLSILVLLLGLLQYRLWFAEGSFAEQHRLELQVEEQTRINAELQARNAVLEREVLELQTGNKGVEQRAREQLGLVREGETFYQIVDTPQAATNPATDPAKEVAPAGPP